MRRKEQRRHNATRFSKLVLGLLGLSLIAVCILFIFQHSHQNGSAAHKVNLKNKEEHYQFVWDIVDNRWDNQMHKPLHATDLYLNPGLYYDNKEIEYNPEIKDGLFHVIFVLCENMEEQIKITTQLFSYRGATGPFGMELAIKARKECAPVEWWLSFWYGCRELQRLAIRVLSLTCSATPCERNWSTFEMIDDRIEEVSHRALNLTDELLSSTSFSRQLADQTTLAKAYIVIAKEHNNLHFAWELSSQVRKAHLLLSKAVKNEESITLDEAEPVIKGLASLIYRAKEAHYDSATTIVSLKKHIESIQDRAMAAITQSAAFGQLAAEELPKDLYCLGIKLTLDWARNPLIEKHANEHKNYPRLVDNNVYHFCIFSDNLLATSVVVNSTVSNANHPKQLVFHIVTDDTNYRAMHAWFFSNDYKGATIDVRSVDEFTWLNASYAPVLKRLQHDMQTSSFRSEEFNSKLKFHHPKHHFLLNHLKFYIPEIHPLLEKVVLLDDDVVVQKDLTPLFSIDLHGNVNGAVETCLETFHRYHKYLNFSNPLIGSKFDPQACGWAFGMNIFDLIAWKNANVTGRYHYWMEQNSDQSLWKLGTLPPGLLAFYGSTEPLDRRWHALGLGYDANIDDRVIASASVIHYNGNMKPWMRLAISRYKPLWDRYVNFSHPIFHDCVVH